MADHARRLDLRRRIQHAADGPLRPEAAPLLAARVHALQRAPGKLATVLVEVPVGNAVDTGHHGRFRPEQRLHQVHHAGHLVRLERDEHVVLRPQLTRIAGAAHARHALLALDMKAHAVGLHGRQVRPACDETHVGARERQLRAHVAANRPCPIDTDLHGLSPRWL
ncbi:hypothetical protein D3C72_1519770 [compost metagenome]